ncbi:hypothetical protein [Candidatus Accumulibacter sp. ACC005]|nr:hypothetical protein [Candidatus Accumulibacter sp. ACC005]
MPRNDQGFPFDAKLTRKIPHFRPFALVGGMVSSTVLTLCVIPALYALVKQWQLRRELAKVPVLPLSES